MLTPWHPKTVNSQWYCKLQGPIKMHKKLLSTDFVNSNNNYYSRLMLASHAGVFRGARISSLPTNACSTENNIPFPFLFSFSRSVGFLQECVSFLTAVYNLNLQQDINQGLSRVLLKCSLPADVLWGSFVTHSFLPHGERLIKVMMS